MTETVRDLVRAPEALNPWDKRRNETPKAFHAFTHYREAGPLRSLRKTAAALECSASLLNNWSAEHDWVDRAGAWDGYLDRERQAELVEEAKAMHRRHAAIATQMMGKALERIRNIDSSKLTVREAVMLVDLGARMERTARGQAELNVRVTGGIEVNGPTGSSILKALRAAPSLMDFAEELDAALLADGMPDLGEQLPSNL